MNSKLIVLLALIAYAPGYCLAQVKSNPAANTEQTRQHRIVYDMSAPDTAQHAVLMRQLNNIKRGWPDAQIEVVIHGKALDLLVKDRSYRPDALKALQAKGVVFAACENSLRARKVTKEQLLPGVITVPMAIGEIVTKQEEGWSYIKF